MSAGRRRARRADDPRLTTIWWRDVPVQVVADGPGGPVRAELPRRFTVAADAAAMAAGLDGSDDYLDHWDRRSRSCGPDLAAEVAAEVERLVAAHPRQRLQALVRAGGVDAPGAAATDPPPDTDPDPARNPS